MHELGITMQVIHTISNRLRDEECTKVNRVVLEIGKLTAILPDAIRFCFDLCSEGTIVEGSTLEIIESSGSELNIKEVEVI